MIPGLFNFISKIEKKKFEKKKFEQKNEQNNNKKMDEYLPIANVVSAEDAIKLKKKKLLEIEEEKRLAILKKQELKNAKLDEKVKCIIEEVDKWLFDDKGTDNGIVYHIPFNYINNKEYIYENDIKYICQKVKEKIHKDLEVKYYYDKNYYYDKKRNYSIHVQLNKIA